MALHERLGFELVGTLREVGRKFDRWIDTRWYGLLLDPDRLPAAYQAGVDIAAPLAGDHPEDARAAHGVATLRERIRDLDQSADDADRAT